MDPRPTVYQIDPSGQWYIYARTCSNLLNAGPPPEMTFTGTIPTTSRPECMQAYATLYRSIEEVNLEPSIVNTLGSIRCFINALSQLRDDLERIGSEEVPVSVIQGYFDAYNSRRDRAGASVLDGEFMEDLSSLGLSIQEDLGRAFALTTTGGT